MLSTSPNLRTWGLPDRRSHVQTIPEASQSGAYIVILPDCAYQGKVCVKAQPGTQRTCPYTRHRAMMIVGGRRLITFCCPAIPRTFRVRDETSGGGWTRLMTRRSSSKVHSCFKITILEKVSLLCGQFFLRETR